MPATKIKAIYIQSGAGICKLNRAAMQAIIGGASWGDAGKWLGASLDHKTDTWRNLPAALYQAGEDDTRLGSCDNSYEVIDMDDADADYIAYYFNR